MSTQQSLDQFVRQLLHKELASNEYYQEAEDKERFLSQYIDGHMTASGMLTLVSSRIDDFLAEIDNL